MKNAYNENKGHNLDPMSIKRHYKDKHVQKVVNKFASYNNASKAGNYDNYGWYEYNGNEIRLINIASDKDYQKLSRKVKRTIYGTLNYFNQKLFEKWEQKENDSPGSFEDTKYYMLSVDIDIDEKCEISRDRALKALRTAGEFIHSKLSEITGGKILTLFSGDGVYIHLHPEFAHLSDKYVGSERSNRYDILTKAFNLHIGKLEQELYKKHPEVHGIIKIDAINNRKRLFKIPLSLHMTYPHVVYPIDIKNNFEIPQKTIPLSDEDILKAETVIDQFMHDKPTELDKKALSILKQYEDQVKVSKRDYKDLQVDIPEEAIPINIITAEPVCKAIFDPKAWNKGDTRRVAFMTATLRLCGWPKDQIKEYIIQIASDWNINSLEHVIESWLTMHPPKIETIYKKGNNYPSMNFGDVREHLPEKPEYSHVLGEIFRIASKEGYKVPYKKNNINNTNLNDKYEPKTSNLDLKYSTDHLKGFDDLAKATGLFGDVYKIYFKCLWYLLVSYLIRKSSIQIGSVRIDGRIPLIYAIPSGRGKEGIKNVTEEFIKYFKGYYGEPVSLHPEQLVGKTVKIPKKDEYQQRKGYLADDFVIIDEAYTLLSSKELNYVETRKYIRTALNPYPGNTIHKRNTEMGREGILEYDPSCLMVLFLQPLRFEDDDLILKGDIRRFLVAFRPRYLFDDIDNALDNRLDEEIDSFELIKSFCSNFEHIPQFEKFNVSIEAKDKVKELSKDLKNRGISFSYKIMNFMSSYAFTLQNFLLKLSAVQAFQNGRSQIEVIDVELAYIDLFEIMEHEYEFIEAKIPGNFDYGEDWMGANLKDQKALKWLLEMGATNCESSTISISDYNSKIQELFKVKERQAYAYIKKHEKRGWIAKKKGFQSSRVWLNFDPESPNLANLAMLQGDDIPVLLNKTQNKYDYYINKYDELVKSNQSEYCNNASIAKMVDTQDQKAVNPELSINSDFDLGIIHSTSNFKYKINNVKEIISSEDEEEYNLILKAAYNCLKDNEKKGIKTNKFDNALLKSIKISEKSIEIEEYKNKMIHDHFIKSDAYAGYIFPLKKLIGLFNK